jgi:hypothetical protein
LGYLELHLPPLHTTPVSGGLKSVTLDSRPTIRHALNAYKVRV